MNKKQYQQFLKESISSIKNFYTNEQLSLFVGAGISVESKLPNWGELIGKLKEELNTKEDDYLKLAQLYYIQYGENVYYKKLLDIFDLESKKSNDLTDEIVKLNCKHIISTNWDNLIEKSISSQGMFYDVVKNDNDFSKLGINTNMLLKMHGDLSDRDIVFKENDYLNYADTHPLSEAFIKSILIRNVVLFIGYSVSDFNVKQIISWVQNRNTNNLPIYFIESRREFDYLEFEYFKEKNIFILYIKDLYSKNIDFIKDINQFENSISDKITFIDTMYHLLKPFENYNFISGFEISEVIKKSFSLYGINEIFFLSWGRAYIYIQTESIVKILRSFSKNDLKQNKGMLQKTKFIYEIFRKSNVKAIAEFRNDNKPIIRFRNNLNIDNDIFYFNKQNIQKSLYKKSYLIEKAFFDYKLENYYEAYISLESCSFESFKNRDFIKYFICEFNKKQFCSLLRFRDKKYDGDFKIEIEGICKKNQTTELFDLYEQLPKSYRQTVKYLLDLEKYIQNKLSYTIRILEDTKKSGKDRFDNISTEMYHFTVDLILNINNNYLMVDHFLYKTYRNIFETIIYEYKYEKINFILYEFVYCAILGYDKWQDLQEFLDDKVLSFSSDNQLSESYLKVYENLLSEYIHQKDLSSIYEQYFTNYFTILTFSKLEEKDINMMADSIIKILETRTMKYNDYKLIDMFISKYYDKINTEVLTNILDTFIHKFICDKFNFNDIEIIDSVNFFGQIFEILKNENISINEQNILTYIEKIKLWDTQTKYKIYSYFLVGIYSIVSEKTKKTIKQTLMSFKVEIQQYKKDIVSNVYEDLVIPMDYKYLYYTYLLILQINDIEVFDKEDEMMKYFKNYDGYNSAFSEIYHIIKRLQHKLKDGEYLKNIENIIKDKGRERCN